MQRIMVGLNQEQLARESGIRRVRVSLIERGMAKPTCEESAKLTEVLAYRVPAQNQEQEGAYA